MRKLIPDVVHDRAPVTLSPDATAKDACRCMQERRVGAVVVTGKDDAPLGIFTGRDAVCRVMAAALDPATTSLAEVMTGNPTATSPRCSAIDALRLMQDAGHRHLPVLDAMRPIGCISRGDFRGLEHARLDEETGLWERI